VSTLVIVLPIVAFLVGLALGCTGTLAAFAPRVAVLETRAGMLVDAIVKLEAAAGRLNTDLNGVAAKVADELRDLRAAISHSEG